MNSIFVVKTLTRTKFARKETEELIQICEIRKSYCAQTKRKRLILHP